MLDWVCSEKAFVEYKLLKGRGHVLFILGTLGPGTIPWGHGRPSRNAYFAEPNCGVILPFHDNIELL